MKAEKKKPVNTRLSKDVIKRWSIFAAENMMNKEEALAEIIVRGTRKK